MKPNSRCLVRYGGALAAAGMGLVFRVALTAWVGPNLPTYSTFFPAIMAVALLAGLGPGLVATAAALVLVDYWVITPHRFGTERLVDAVGMGLFALMGLFMSLMAEFYRRHRDKAAAYDCETVLRESRGRLAAFAEATFEGVVESEAGRILECNEQLARMLGYSVTELKGMEIAKLIAPEDRDRVTPNIRQGRESSLELAVLRKDGTRIVVEAHGRPESPGSAVRRTVIRDLSEHKRAAAALRESEWFARSVAEASPHWFYVFDIDSMGLSYANRPILRDLGYPPEVHNALTGLEAFRAYMPPEEMPHLARLLQEWQTLPDGAVRDDEYRLRHADGTWHYFAGREVVFARRADGTVQRILGTLLDITERKHAEQALRQSREDLDRAQAVAQIGWWRLDTRQNVLTWSDENHRMFGVPKGTPLTYEAFLGTVHPDDRQYVDMRWNAGLRGEPYDIEHRIVADGQVKWVREKAYLEFDEAGALLGGFGITQDITARKLVEEKLRASHDELTRFNQAMVGRELRMIELKEEVNDLCARLGQPPRYGGELDEAARPKP